MKIKVITRKTRPATVGERFAELNLLMRGWANYFRHATGFQKLKDLDAWIRCRLWYCIWKQWKRPKRRLRAFLQLGIPNNWAHRFAYSRKGGWRLSCGPVMGMSVTEDRLRERGYMPFLEYYFALKYGKAPEKKRANTCSMNRRLRDPGVYPERSEGYGVSLPPTPSCPRPISAGSLCKNTQNEEKAHRNG